MTPKEQAEELYDMFSAVKKMYDSEIKAIALRAVNLVIASNPHSNPLNTEVHSTMDYWFQVKKEIEKL
jgi:hypothetical protein